MPHNSKRKSYPAKPGHPGKMPPKKPAMPGKEFGMGMKGTGRMGKGQGTTRRSQK